MREIVTEHQAKAVAKQSACYLCGLTFKADDKINREHVVPKGIFQKEDRTFPLILPAHENSNSEFSIADEQAKQLLAALYGDIKRLPIRTEAIAVIHQKGEPSGILLDGFPLHRMIHRIMKGCHTALYGECLLNETPSMVLTPLPSFDRETGEAHKHNFLEQHEVFCKILKSQRRIGQIDRIHAYNGKFKFESVWAVSDDGSTRFVVACIDIYGWHRLGDQVLGRTQGCILSYNPKGNAIPDGASVVSNLELPYRFAEPLNPWE
jgi:hypothetical protein